jgi:hypothetical protein
VLVCSAALRLVELRSGFAQHLDLQAVLAIQLEYQQLRNCTCCAGLPGDWQHHAAVWDD